MHMLTYIFATRNKHKIQEFQSLLPPDIRLIGLDEVGFTGELMEPFDTLEDNSRIKALTVYEALQQDCLAEDSGLEVNALQGAPGAHSARFAGDQATDEQNIMLLLSKLQGITDRSAQFRTVITLIWKGKLYQVEGRCAGQIIEPPRGNNGFGYDPIFIPEGSRYTFAEMSLAEKNQYSHRARAVKAWIALLQQLTYSKQ